MQDGSRRRRTIRRRIDTTARRSATPSARRRGCSAKPPRRAATLPDRPRQRRVRSARSAHRNRAARLHRPHRPDGTLTTRIPRTSTGDIGTPRIRRTNLVLVRRGASHSPLHRATACAQMRARRRSSCACALGTRNRRPPARDRPRATLLHPWKSSGEQRAVPFHARERSQRRAGPTSPYRREGTFGAPRRPPVGCGVRRAGAALLVRHSGRGTRLG